MADEEPAEDEQIEERAVVRDQEDGSVPGDAVEPLDPVHPQPAIHEQPADQRRDHCPLPDPRRPPPPALVQEAHHAERDPLHPAQRRESRLVSHQNPGTSLAMISFMISLVPPPMVSRRASRKARATGVSTTYPIPPWSCWQSETTFCLRSPARSLAMLIS